MSSIASLNKRFPSAPAPPRSPFPQSSQGFERVLIAAANPNKKHRGLAQPTPTRASALRIPPASFKFTTGKSNKKASVQTTFRPLPLSNRLQTTASKVAHPMQSIRPVQSAKRAHPINPPLAKPALATPPQTSPGSLANEMVSDFQEYQQMKARQSSEQAHPSISERPATPIAPKTKPIFPQDIAQPFARAMSQTQNISIPEQTVPERIQHVPRSPFPNLGQNPAAPAVVSAPKVTPTMATKRSALAAYKDEQLLANAGGDDYVRKAGTMRVDRSYEHSRFTRRVGKDLKDAGENLKDAAGDLSTGSTTHRRSPSGEVVAQRRPGLFKTLGNFTKDVISGATLGIYRPQNDPAPKGFSRLFYPFKKIVVDGVVKDLVVGVPASFLRAGEHTTLAALNATESVPDATIGNFSAGRKVTSAAFDGMQVGTSFVADVLPTGDAWSRVGASGRGGKLGVPVVSNLRAPEYDTSDPRFAGVRNTPFRKGIETVGTLGAGAVMAAATAPAAALEASAAMRTGSNLNARQAAQPNPSTAAAPAAPTHEPNRVASVPLQNLSAAQSVFEQPVVARRQRPHLWE